MSYCRMGPDSDVYVYRRVEDNMLECCGCKLNDNTRVFDCPTDEEMLNHLKHHLSTGHQVPAAALERLERGIRASLVEDAFGRGPQSLGYNLPQVTAVPTDEWAALKAYIRSLRAIKTGGKDAYDANVASHEACYGKYL